VMLQDRRFTNPDIINCKIYYCMKNAVLWDVAPWRSWLNRRFRGTYGLHLQGRKIRERGTSVSRWRHIPEDGILHSHRRETSNLTLYFMFTNGDLHSVLQVCRKGEYFESRSWKQGEVGENCITKNFYNCPIIIFTEYLTEFNVLSSPLLRSSSQLHRLRYVNHIL
jgi:hypothetical protein